MNDGASVTSLSLTVVEDKPRRNGNGGCVGMFFQLFDWNRRFTKKKLFSKRLLPPDRAKDGSNKFGGDDKMPKLRLIADENSGGFPNTNNGVNGVQTPGLVARLMGLESMPSVHRKSLHKDDSDEFSGWRREKVVGDNGGEFRPQKVQKTGTVDKRCVTRFGAEALQLKNVLSQSKKHHHPKLASPVKSTGHHQKRNASRLVGVATRILEPGLHARNKSRYAVSYGQGASRLQQNGLSSRPVGQGASRLRQNGLRSEPVKSEDLDLVIEQTSCRNCGSLIDQEQRLVENNRDQLKFNCFPIGSETKDFVALNRGLNSRTWSRVPTKGEDMKFESARVSCASPRQKRQVMHNRPRMVSNGQSTEKQMGSCFLQTVHDGVAFRFSSPMKNNPNASVCQPTSRKRFTSNPSNGKIRSTRIGLQLTRSEKVLGLIGGKNSDHLSPGSVLEAWFSNDSCCSSSLEDSSVRTQHTDSMSYSYDNESQFEEPETNPFDYGGLLRKVNSHNKLVADLLTYITQVLCSIDHVNSRTNGNIKEVIFNSELVLGSQTPHNPNEINSFFICDLLLDLDTLAHAMWARFGNFLGPGHQLKRFVFDSLIEYLESKYVQYSKCGFRVWMSLPRFMGFDHLVSEVVEEVRRWTDVSLGELCVEMDMSHGSGEWIDFEIEAYEMGANVEWDILQMLIDEIVVDVSTWIGGFRV